MVNKEIKYTDFEQIGVSIDAFLSSHNLAGKIKKYNLSKIWGQIVGKKFEKRSYPHSLSNKVLRVACENAQITSELGFCKRLILEKLKLNGEKIGLDIADVIFSHKHWNPNEIL